MWGRSMFDLARAQSNGLWLAELGPYWGRTSGSPAFLVMSGLNGKRALIQEQDVRPSNLDRCRLSLNRGLA